MDIGLHTALAIGTFVAAVIAAAAGIFQVVAYSRDRRPNLTLTRRGAADGPDAAQLHLLVESDGGRAARGIAVVAFVGEREIGRQSEARFNLPIGGRAEVTMTVRRSDLGNGNPEDVRFVAFDPRGRVLGTLPAERGRAELSGS